MAQRCNYGEPQNILMYVKPHMLTLLSYLFASRTSCFLQVGELDSGVAKVEEWQRTIYGIDSGIQSGATTVKDDDGDYTTGKHYTMTTTTVTREEPGKAISSVHILIPLP